MKSIILLAGLILGLTVAGAPLELGQPAPELVISKWVKNGPVSIKNGKGKNVYIVEFWATWCPPCRMSIPHLTDLQKKYKDKGLVVVGITQEEPGTVEAFVKAQNDMDYSVGVDTIGDTYRAYMDGKSGIPQAFIVNRDGIVVWNGHPLEIDSVLEKVIAGTFDMALNRQVAELETKLMDAVQAQDMEAGLALAKDILVLSPDNERAMQVAIYIYTQTKRQNDALEFLDKLIVMHPAESKPYMVKLQMMSDLNDRENIKILANTYIKQFGENGSKLNSLAWFLLDRLPFGTQPLKEALTAAEQSVAVTPPSDKMLLAAHIDTLARCYYAVGRIDKAVAEEQKAVALLKGTEEEVIFMDKLKFYNSALQLGQEIK